MNCESDVHRGFKLFSGFMVVVYPIGVSSCFWNEYCSCQYSCTRFDKLIPKQVPVLFMSVMWPHRLELSDPAARKSDRAASKYLSFFVADYGGKTWYFELW